MNKELEDQLFSELMKRLDSIKSSILKKAEEQLDILLITRKFRDVLPKNVLDASLEAELALHQTITKSFSDLDEAIEKIKIFSPIIGEEKTTLVIEKSVSLKRGLMNIQKRLEEKEPA